MAPGVDGIWPSVMSSDFVVAFALDSMFAAASFLKDSDVGVEVWYENEVSGSLLVTV